MRFKILILTLIMNISIYSCAEYQVNTSKNKIQKNYYSSMGFALIYDDIYFEQSTLKKKIDNNKLETIHSFLKVNTPIKIINPENGKFVDTKVSKRNEYPKIFNLVISEKIAAILDLDINNPYIEVLETKKNKTFVAKEGTTFEEERKVADTAPVNDIKMNDLSSNELKSIKKKSKSKNFLLVISDFYYLDSAKNLKKELNEKTNLNNLVIQKISNTKYRLLAGPFKNFNALKTSYISLNNLGFEDLNIYRK